MDFLKNKKKQKQSLALDWLLFILKKMQSTCWWKQSYDSGWQHQGLAVLAGNAARMTEAAAERNWALAMRSWDLRQTSSSFWWAFPPETDQWREVRTNVSHTVKHTLWALVSVFFRLSESYDVFPHKLHGHRSPSQLPWGENNKYINT